MDSLYIAYLGIFADDGESRSAAWAFRNFQLPWWLTYWQPDVEHDIEDKIRCEMEKKCVMEGSLEILSDDNRLPDARAYATRTKGISSVMILRAGRNMSEVTPHKAIDARAWYVLRRICKRYHEFEQNSTILSHEIELEKALKELWADSKSEELLSKMQVELDNTTVILLDTLLAIMTRGEKIENLVAKSEYVKKHSWEYFRKVKAETSNDWSCCEIM